MKEFLPFHGGQLREIAVRFGVPASELLDFSANINPEGPPASVLSCLRSALDDPAALTRYPDLAETELNQSLACYAGVRTETVTVANGFVPLLEAVIRVLPIQRCHVPVPAFVEYRRTLERLGVEMMPHNIKPDSAFSYDAINLRGGMNDAVLLANPQNPSGVLSSRDTLLRIVGEAAQRNLYVLLDEAFIDYCPESSVARDVDRFPNLIVFRSVTKFFGMPGMRVAYVLANPNASRAFQEVIAPWSITTLASLAACIAVRDRAYADRTMARNNERRQKLHKALDRLGIHVYQSAANFLLFRLPESVAREGFWEQMIRGHHIVLRNCGNYETLDGWHFRAAVRTDAENDRLVEALSRMTGVTGPNETTAKAQHFETAPGAEEDRMTHWHREPSA